ncbi:MAG: aminotransferase class V-fold PLP-dependent enzyme, partial [Deltaproteobacteria bacterium]|nr:aminotransferase class V-fold PLP-dependent enzyme [Deltaproteobacteria bacterium]
MAVAYLDYNASSPLAEELIAELPLLAQRGYGNPSSVHKLGRECRRMIVDSTDTTARAINSRPEDLVWTSGASEANSWVLKSLARSRILVSAIEHDSTRLAADATGARVETIGVDSSGRIDLDSLAGLLAAGPADLVSTVHASNETGVIQPIREIAELARRHGVPLHVDCAQTLGKIAVDFERLGADYATFSAHKIGGPKGVGFLATHRHAPRLAPLVGGKQQRGLRGGTENTLGVALTGRALALLDSES